MPLHDIYILLLHYFTSLVDSCEPAEGLGGHRHESVADCAGGSASNGALFLDSIHKQLPDLFRLYLSSPPEESSDLSLLRFAAEKMRINKLLLQ